MSLRALKRGAPQRRHSSAHKDSTAFMVRTTDVEWEALHWASNEYGDTIGQFAADAVTTWLDRTIDIPRRIYMRPMTSASKRLFIDRAILDKVNEVQLVDTSGRAHSFNNSDVVMSAILSFIQGMLDNRPAAHCVSWKSGYCAIDPARPAMSVELPN